LESFAAHERANRFYRARGWTPVATTTTDGLAKLVLVKHRNG
jgi:hypothetical protein